jgi:hypothetical protein
MDAVLTDRKFSVTVPDPKHACTIRVHTLKNPSGIYEGTYEYIGGPYQQRYRGTIKLEKEETANGGHTLHGKYLEESLERESAPHEDVWEFIVDPQDDSS